jgi:GrpB-like predicted nucleotidyltransferase (UPF0157 family)
VAVEVVDYRAEWPQQFERVAARLRSALAHVPSVQVEHVGSTSVPGLAAKPVLDIDVIVEDADWRAALHALESMGYLHRGDLGIDGREAFAAPDDTPRRHVYLCRADGCAVRNHLAVRDVLRRDALLRDEYAAAKERLASLPGMDIDTYVAGKSAVLQKILARSGRFTPEELTSIARANGSL